MADALGARLKASRRARWKIKRNVGEKKPHLLESHQIGARGGLSVSTIDRQGR